MHAFGIQGVQVYGEYHDFMSMPAYEAVYYFVMSFLAEYSLAIYFFISGYVFFLGVDDFTLGVWKRKLRNRLKTLLIPFIGMIDIGSSILQSLRLAHISMLSSFARNILIVVMLFFASSVSLDAIYWSLFVAEVVGGLLMLWLAREGFRHYRHGREKPESA